MFSKFAFFALLVVTVKASGGYSSFSYDVSDPNTGDIKDQHENRVGSNVVGKYSLLEADGTKRVVEYSADDATGFKAVVHKEPAGVGAYGAVGGLANPALAGSFGHGFGAGAYGGLGGLANPALAGSLGHGSRFAGASPYAYGSGALGYAGAGLGAGSLYGGYNGLGNTLGYNAAGTPTASSYSHSILHNGPDSRPYGGAYGRYGAYGGNRGYGTPYAGAGLGLGAGWSANNAGWSSNNAGWSANSLAAGAYNRGLGYGSQLSW